MNEGKNGSDRSVSGVRAMTRPTASAFETDSALALESGVQPRSRAALRMRWRVSSPTPGRLFRANDTALFDTPAARATSAIVGRGMRST